jgi:4-hydroxybenzoate polyprenyltransferase
MREHLVGRLLQFVLERYSPIAYGPLIVCLVIAGQAGAALSTGQGLRVSWETVMATLAVALGFLQLRILDELADAELDRLGRPDRPLPRGLVSAPELGVLAVAAALGGIASAASLGSAAVTCYGLALGQIWLLAAAASRGQWATRGAVADALGHSMIVPAMLAVGWASTGPLVPHPVLACILLLAWGAGLALEVGRKVVTAPEERPGIVTYSGALGRRRALALLAGFLGATAAGAAFVAATVGAASWVSVLPVVVVGAVVAAAVVGLGRLGTASIRATVPALVLAALVWPSLLALGLR